MLASARETNLRSRLEGKLSGLFFSPRKRQLHSISIRLQLRTGTASHASWLQIPLQGDFCAPTRPSLRYGSHCPPNDPPQPGGKENRVESCYLLLQSSVVSLSGIVACFYLNCIWKSSTTVPCFTRKVKTIENM